jgi:hypothetical protein
VDRGDAGVISIWICGIHGGGVGTAANLSSSVDVRGGEGVGLRDLIGESS